jgi:hypothetical protein
MRTKTKGQALTEFALILPLLLLLILGIIEGARIIWSYVQLQNAAREAVRYAVSGQPWGRISHPEDCALVSGASDGDPWMCDDDDRVARIKDVAMSYGDGLSVKMYASADQAEYDYYASTPGAFGILVKGQQNANDNVGSVNYPSRPGLNVLVHLYYNVELLDPIYRAIIPQGWLQINAEVMMQNEGIDTTASGLAPVGMGGGAPMTGGGGVPPGGGSRVPKISIGEAQPVPAGSTITILLEDHQPSTTYDVFFDSILVGTVTTNAQYAAQIQYYIPLNMAGDHTIHSELPGSGAAVASALVQVDLPVAPAITVDNGSRWPRGSPITIRIVKHDPNTVYNIYFAGGRIGNITTDSSGAGSLAYTIPTSTALGTVHIESRAGSFSPAGTDIVVTQPSIVVQGGTVWPPGTLIFIILRDHAPGQTYSVYFRDTLIDSAVVVNPIGEAILSYVIPITLPDGIYAITSRQGTATLAQLNVQVDTPPTPYIVIPGGYEWPAGSPITIQLRKHSANMNYRVYFGSNLLGTFLVDGAGQANIAYSIPVTQTVGIAAVRSVRTDNGNQEATVDVTVTAVPTISVDGGLTQAPGATITIRLTHHAANAAYDVYLGGVKVGTVTTNGSGEATFTYTIPAGTASGSYPLESRPHSQSTAVANATLTVLAPDLVLTSIQTPPHPVFNTPMPITITVQNNSAKAISGQYFDIDLYLDPTVAPLVSDLGLPPGSRKYWFNTIPASGTLTITDTITLWGPTAHAIYARADTSGNILEMSENNNILGTTVAPDTCAVEIADEFGGANGTMPADWASVFYGNANPSSTYNYADPEVSQNNGTLYVYSDGRSTTEGDDDGSAAGYAFVYREAAGDFDVYVQVVSNNSYGGYQRSGLEVRDDLNGTAAKVNLLLDMYGTNRVRLANRGNSNIANATANYPVWLRLLRRGNTFSAFYSTTAHTPPEASDWTWLRDVDQAMNGTVYIGLVNAAQYWNSTRSRNWASSNFDHFHYCGDPAGTRACGEVNETGGVVALDARNYTDNIIRGGQAWETTVRAGLLGMTTPDSGVSYANPPYAANSPELRYQVRFSTPGRYYINLLAWGPNTSGNSVHMGLQGAETSSATDIDGFTTSSTSPPTWYPGSGSAWYIDIPSAGTYVVNLWMREDGAQVFKILLSTDPNYPLTGFGPDQSPCTVTAPETFPPGYARCSQVLVNGDFEGGLVQDVLPYWVMAEGELVGRTNVHYISTGTSFGVILPSSSSPIPHRPWLYQQFAMPDWVLTNTTAVLNLKRGVDWLSVPQNEPLYFYLRSTAGVTLTTPVTIATGQDFPVLNPSAYNNSQWATVSVDVMPNMVAAGYNPINFANQTLQAYFISPNPGTYSTEFYMDKITLDICTTQPLPSPINTSLGGTVTVNQSLRSGVNVWAYMTNGPIFTTYSIQGGTYHFYNLPAGTYLVYAEYWLSGTRFTAQTYVTIPPNTVTKNLTLYP